MAKSIRTKATLDDALDVKSVWQAIPDFTMGSISLKQFVAVHDAADSLDKEYSQKGVELDGVKANRDDKVRELNDLVTRFRSGIRAAYGPDSAVYERAARMAPGCLAIPVPPTADSRLIPCARETRWGTNSRTFSQCVHGSPRWYSRKHR